MTEKREPSVCISYWLPLLLASGVPTPKTILIETDVDLIHLCDGQSPDGFDGFLDKLHEAAIQIGFPFFLRTGYGSGKHDWERTCFVKNSARLASHVAALVQWSACVDIWGFPTETWAVREFLPLESTFTCYRGMPVNRERRYFFQEGHVVCHHPYWPTHAVELGRPSNPEWRTLLTGINDEPEDEVEKLTGLTELVSKQFQGAWSLDWARDHIGRWVAIDMAPAARSWHWPGCPAAKALGWKGE